MPRAKGSKNARTNSNSTSKLAAVIRTKRTTTTRQHAVTDVEPTIVEFVRDNPTLGSSNDSDATREQFNNLVVAEFERGSGELGRSDRGRTGNGSDDSGSGVTPDVRTGSGETRKRRGRPRTAELDAQGTVRVRKPRAVKVEVEEGVEASTLLLSGTLQGLCEVVATVTANPLYKINSNEGNEVASAIQDCMSALPKAALKKYNAYMQKIRPWQNLAVVLTKVIYPRYVYAQMQKEANAQTEARNVTNSEQPTGTSEGSFNAYAQADERASD